MKKNKEKFTVYKDAEDNFYPVQDEKATRSPVELAVERPNYEKQQHAQFTYSKSFTDYIKNGVATQVQLLDIMKQNGIWGEDKEKEERKLLEKINANRIKLKRGRIKLGEGFKLAKENINLLFEWITLTGRKNDLFTNSAESRAEQAKFDYLVSACTVYNSNGDLFFKNLEDYLEHDAKGNPVPIIAGQYFAKLTQNLDEDFRKDWPEYKFLEKYNFVDSKLRWINKDGHLVDENGNLVNDKGQKVDKNEVVIDENFVDENVEAEFYPDEEPVKF